jgi:hypothetical protein
MCLYEKFVKKDNLFSPECKSAVIYHLPEDCNLFPSTNRDNKDNFLTFCFNEGMPLQIHSLLGKTAKISGFHLFNVEDSRWSPNLR